MINGTYDPWLTPTNKSENRGKLGPGLMLVLHVLPFVVVEDGRG